MKKMNSLLTERLKGTAQGSKMTDLATLSSAGNLSSFAGVFRVSPLNKEEETRLKNLLIAYQSDEVKIDRDFSVLAAITSEVRAINNQAAVLHGERIKRAQELLKTYRDGAFSAWLKNAYGNRQTPYNFLHYYEFHAALSLPLQEKLEQIPRQAIYTLASRNGHHEKKEEIVRNYKGESKEEMLSQIRSLFPLKAEDARGQDLAESVLTALKKIQPLFTDPLFTPDAAQKKKILHLLKELAAHARPV